MKITIQAFKDTFTWESEIDSVDLSEVIYQIKGLLVAAGYHPRNVDDCFSPDAFEWFPQENEEQEPNHGQESGRTPNWNKPHPSAEPLRQALKLSEEAKEDEF